MPVHCPKDSVIYYAVMCQKKKEKKKERERERERERKKERKLGKNINQLVIEKIRSFFERALIYWHFL